MSEKVDATARMLGLVVGTVCWTPARFKSECLRLGFVPPISVVVAALYTHNGEQWANIKSNGWHLNVPATDLEIL